MRTCLTCKSPYVEEIDQMVLAGWQIKEIERFLKGKYPDDPNLPSYTSLVKHSRNHVIGLVKRVSSASRVRQKAIQKEIRASIQSAEQLRKNLFYISKSLEEMWKDWGNKDPKRYNNLATLIGAGNKTIDLLIKFQDEIQKGGITEEDMYERLIFAVQELPSHMIDIVIERWDNYVK